MKIKALFSDYDGTLASGSMRRDISRIPESIERELRKIGTRVPFAIITSKDFDFIFPRTSFAKAWACVCGLEIRLANGKTISSGSLVNAESVLPRINRMEGRRVLAENKRDHRGKLLGLSIDWREGEKPPDEIMAEIKELSAKGLYVNHNAFYPFIDIFAGPPDKGKALRDLKRLLQVKGNVMYTGDSPLDNSAFRKADIAVGISHGQPLEELDCEFVVSYDELGVFLSSLYERELDFTPNLPGVGRMRG